jgi:hypothetical protein
MRKLCSYLVVAWVVYTAVSTIQAQKGKGAASAAASPTAAAAPAASSTPATSSSAAIESQMLAFGALDHIAASIASQACTHLDSADQNPTIVIFDQASFANLQAYQGFLANANAVKSLYYSLLQTSDAKTDESSRVEDCRKAAIQKRITLFPNSQEAHAAQQQSARQSEDKKACDIAKAAGQPCPKPHAIGLSSTIDPFSDATSLLSAIAVASNSESPGSIAIPDSAMAVAVTSQMKQVCGARNLTAIYPPLFGKSSISDISASDMESIVQELHDVRGCVIQQLDQRNNGWPRQQGTNGATGTAATSSDPITTPAFTDVTTMYESFMNSLLQVNSSTGTLGSGAVEQGYQLATVLAGPMDQDKAVPTYSHPAYILLASILSAGGTMRDHKSLWTALGNGDKITFSGGLMVNVALWHADSEAPIYANILRYRVPFSNVSAPNGAYSDTTQGDNLAIPTNGSSSNPSDPPAPVMIPPNH